MAGTDNDGSINLEKEKEWYKKLLNEENFEKLEVELRKPNIFNILGIGRAEIRHSNFLGWLLDPNASHGLGNRLLIRILRDLATKESKKNQLDIFEINELNFSNVEVQREASSYEEDDKKKRNGAIDLLIVFRDENDKFVICIENKIDTTDSDGQLTKYRNHINDAFSGFKTVFVYLTPIGTDPDDSNEAKEWDTYSYTEIIEHLENIQNSITDSIIKTYIFDYLTTLKREIMGTNDEATKIANEIYNYNQDIFRFVYDNVSDELQKLIWEKDYHWMVESVENFISLIKKVDNNEYNLGFTKNYISLTRNGKKIYAFFSPTKAKQYSLEFAFSTSEKNEKQIREEVGTLLKNLSEQKAIQSTWNKDATYFVITAINEIIKDYPETLQEIHKKRFEINS
jgi:hypothetical protein